jgi:hypothetical protein
MPFEFRESIFLDDTCNLKTRRHNGPTRRYVIHGERPDCFANGADALLHASLLIVPSLTVVYCGAGDSDDYASYP